MDDSSICAVTLNDDCSNTNHRDKEVFLKCITDDDNTNKIIIIFYNIIL